MEEEDNQEWIEFTGEEYRPIKTRLRRPPEEVSEHGESFTFDPLSPTITDGSVGDVNVTVQGSQAGGKSEVVVSFGGMNLPNVHFDTESLIFEALAVAEENGYPIEVEEQEE